MKGIKFIPPTIILLIRKYEIVLLKNDELIYTRGIKRRRKVVINLNEIERVELNLFHFAVHLKNGKQVEFPLGFNEQSYIYGILKYHRPKISEKLVKEGV